MSGMRSRSGQSSSPTTGATIEETEQTMTGGSFGTARATDKYRVQLDFSGKAVAELDQLKEIVGASSRADVIRNALRWLFWCSDQVSSGATILVELNGKQREVVFPFVMRKVQKAEASPGRASS